MASKLEVLLNNISPEETIERAQAAASRALNSILIISEKIDTWGEFKELMAEFYCLVESNMIGLEKSRQMNLFMDWGCCLNLFLKKYGHRGGRAAFSIAQSGVEGGLFSVLKYIAETLTQQFTTNWIQCRIGEFWNNLSTEERLAAPLEYLEKYRHILPQEILEQNPYLFGANFYRFLEYHPQMMKELKNIR